MQRPMTPEEVSQKIKEQSNIRPRGGKAENRAKKPQEDLNQHNQERYDYEE